MSLYISQSFDQSVSQEIKKNVIYCNIPLATPTYMFEIPAIRF